MPSGEGAGGRLVDTWRATGVERARCLASADALVQPRKRAAYAPVLLEALASGVPVVAFDSGTALVQRAGATMGEVVASVRRVSDVVAEISAASNEQSTGIEEVNRAITQMDEVTQQNAALVEEAAAAAGSLQE